MKSNLLIKDIIEIRNYRSSDYQATLNILKELSSAFDIKLNKWRQSSGLRQFKSHLKRETLVVEIKSTGEIIGMGVIEAQKNVLGNYLGYMDNWAIKKEFIGKHVGQLLADKAIQILRLWGCESVRINLKYKAPPKLLKVFEHSGFHSINIILEKKLKKK